MLGDRKLNILREDRIMYVVGFLIAKSLHFRSAIPVIFHSDWLLRQRLWTRVMTYKPWLWSAECSVRSSPLPVIRGVSAIPNSNTCTARKGNGCSQSLQCRDVTTREPTCNGNVVTEVRRHFSSSSPSLSPGLKRVRYSFTAGWTDRGFWKTPCASCVLSPGP